MKKITSWMLILCICMTGLWGCGQRADGTGRAGADAADRMGADVAGRAGADVADKTGTDSSAVAGGSAVFDTGTVTETQNGTAPQVSEGTPVYTNQKENRANYFEILDVEENAILVCGLGETKGLYRVGHGAVQKDADGSAIQVPDLKSGMVVELVWNGNIQESYPGQFSYDELRITREQGSPEFDFYRQLMKDLAEVDPGLNEGITESYFDLTAVDSLSQEEKEGLAYVAGSYFGAWGSLATEKELADNGVLEPVTGLEHGILIKVDETSNGNGKLTCNASKFRSGTGAYYFANVTAVCKDGVWSYEVGERMIS